MSHESAERMLRTLRRFRRSLVPLIDEQGDQVAREAYVVLVTLEGALAHGHTSELAQACAEFCEERWVQDWESRVELNDEGDSDQS